MLQSKYNKHVNLKGESLSDLNLSVLNIIKEIKINANFSSKGIFFTSFGSVLL